MSVSFERAAGAATLPGHGLGLGVRWPWSRIAKLGGAAAVLTLGVYAVMSDQFAIATDNAVVSAYSVALRAPIEGVVGGAALRVGARVERGAVLANVNNSLVDDQRLVDLRASLGRARVQAEAIASEEQALDALGKELEFRTRAYMHANASRLAGSISEAQNTQLALLARRDQAERSLYRRNSLAQGGFASDADLDKAQSDFTIASREVAAQQGRLDALRAQAAAVDLGVVSEPGSNDVAYSEQRADEIAIRLRDLEEQRRIAIAAVNELKERLESEQVRLTKLSSASMVAPTSGIVWKLNATEGERVGVGDTIAQIVDCHAAFIIATVPQNRVPDIEVGGRAEYRLSGDDRNHLGRVVSVTGDATGGDHNLAAIPFEQKGLTATLRVALDSDRGECPIGRTARVVIPSMGSRSLSRLFSRWF